MVQVSVPGKIYLMGEHAVVYGKPALLAAINKRLTVTVEGGKMEHDEYIDHILAIITKHFHLTKVPALRITITSEILPGYHLGSSAAVAAGVVGAVTFFLKKAWNPALINQLAYEAEKLKHGNPSGGDNTIVTMGGFIWYRKELEFLKSIWQLPIKTKLTHFSLIDTGKPKETTKDMVVYVASQKNLEKYFNKNEQQTKRIAAALKENDEQALIDAIRSGEETLEAIGVVSQKAKQIIRTIEKAGGAAKILGGGGRADGVGYLLCYSRRPLTGSIPIVLGEEGIRLEKNV